MVELRVNGVNIKHALNGGEKELTIDDKTYKVNGFCEETNTVYEFYGGFWHGCPSCYKPNAVNTKNKKDMGTLNDQTIEKRETIKNAGYNHVSIYEYIYIYISSYKHLTLTGIRYNTSRLLNKNITKLRITLNYQRLSSKYGDNNWLMPKKKRCEAWSRD